MKQNKFIKFAPTLASITLILAAQACGPQSFAPQVNSLRQNAAGNMNIPPKVDVLLGVSMNGTMRNIYPNMIAEIQDFARGLEASGWDYRFTSIPLAESSPGASFSPANRVAASHYSGNWGSAWLAPFPGALITDPTLVVNPNLYSSVFVFPNSISAPNDGHETGIQNEVDFLNRSDVWDPANPNNGFIRKDALLAVITLSNGSDTSGGSWVQAWNGYQWQAPNPDNLPALENSMINVKSGQSQLVKYYSLISPSNTSSCRGAYAWPGTRYINVSNALNGISIDICNNTLPAALSAVAANLHSQKLNFVKEYLVIGAKPEPTSIKVIKYVGGVASNAMEVKPTSVDPVNGYDYLGYQTGIYTITGPVPMDQESGYMIRLHGSSILHGDDSADVQYTNAH